MTATQALGLTIASLNLAMVIALTRFLPRFWREMPWLVALTAYFALRTAKRFVGAANHHEAIGLDLYLDLILLPVLVLIIVASNRMIAGFQAARDEAEYRRDEYERARRDYEQLVRHRLFNPLTVVRGAAMTLKAGVPDDQVRDSLLDAICDAADAIQNTTLEPERRSGEEHTLDAVPGPLRRQADSDIRHAS